MEETGRSGVTSGSEVECKVWLLGSLKTSVDSGSMLGPGEGLKGPDSEARENSRFCIWDLPVGGAPTKVSSGCKLGLTLGCGVGEENSVSGDGGRDFVGVAEVEEE